MINNLEVTGKYLLKSSYLRLSLILLTLYCFCLEIPKDPGKQHTKYDRLPLNKYPMDML